jgi:hypothetical protein
VYQYDQVRHVHLEPSSRCNAACPMCTRNMCGSTSPGLQLADLSLADVRAIFPPEFAAKLEGVDFCGAYGDPVLAPDLLEIVAYFRAQSPGAKLIVYTNGGVRSPSWWADLAGAVGRPGRVIFGIDGVGETNGVYRRNVNYERVIANASAFIKAGGEAQWDFLVFRHNEHQLEEVRRLSRELGFAEFQPKKTGRFVRSVMEFVPELDGAPDAERFPVYSPQGDVVGQLEPPTDPAWRNSSAATIERIRTDQDGVTRMLDSTPIHCRALHTRSVYVGVQGYVFPCCQSYTAATLPQVYGRHPEADTQLEQLIESLGGFDRINAHQVGLKGAVESDAMAAIERSWALRSLAEGRLKVCARVCGTVLGTFEKQFASAELVPGPVTRGSGDALGDH